MGMIVAATLFGRDEDSIFIFTQHHVDRFLARSIDRLRPGFIHFPLEGEQAYYNLMLSLVVTSHALCRLIYSHHVWD